MYLELLILHFQFLPSLQIIQTDIYTGFLHCLFQMINNSICIINLRLYNIDLIH